MKEYKNFSFLPNTNPRWPQSVEAYTDDELEIFFDQIVGDYVIGSNLNNCWPKQPTDYKFERTYAYFGFSELIRIDFI